MKKPCLLVLLPLACLLSLRTGAQQLSPQNRPLVLSLVCAEGDCPLLKVAPQTHGMRAGMVRLKHGQSVGWHSTDQNEEALVILHGSGVAKLEGQSDIPLRTRMLAYIPPNTRHNVTNTGPELLEYTWVVAPAKP